MGKSGQNHYPKRLDVPKKKVTQTTQTRASTCQDTKTHVDGPASVYAEHLSINTRKHY